MLKRLIPSSLLGQVMTVLAAGLLIAQSISAFLLYQASEQRRETALVNAVAFRLIGEVSRPRRAEQRRQNRELRRLQREERGERLTAPRLDPFTRRPRIDAEQTSNLPIKASETRLEQYEDALREILEQQGLEPKDIVMVRRIAGEDPFIQGMVERRPRWRRSNWQEQRILVAAVERTDQEGWLTVRTVEPRRVGQGVGVILMQTAFILVVLVFLLYLVLRRITRPLAKLTTRVADFSQRPDHAVMLEESGPSDTRRLIAAHNAMEARIAALLDEKDVMLGAIGHDLKTPLAALRVRIESVPDDVQRSRMAESIEDITATLDDILSLARIGRSGSAPEAAELGALAISVAEEFEDLGDPVTITDPPRVVAQVQVTWLKRALRNLIVNAVRYGKEAKVSLVEHNGMAILRVDDAGHGIPEDEIAKMLEPFARGESSRNRATGGAGLGLTLARAIAEQHGGKLVLSNLSGGGNRAGLRAELHLPVRSKLCTEQRDFD